MQKQIILVEHDDLSDLRNGLRKLSDVVQDLRDEAHNKRVRTQRQETMLTLPEVCAHLRISRSTAFKWIGNGTLSPVRAGRKNLFPLADVDSMLTKVNNNRVRGY